MKSEQKFVAFSDFRLQDCILNDIAKLGFEEPTPVQAKCIPPALEGKDVIGLAQTGTGKTAAYGLPIIQRVDGSTKISALILAPTRELAAQIAASLRKLGRSSNVRVAVIVGGVSKKNDFKAFSARPNIVVATPGRLIDHIQSRSVRLSDVKILAVDEADRMYDMGFMPQVDQILQALPSDRQTLMLTATMPKMVEMLVRRNMKSPVRVQIGATAPAARAEQKLYQVQESDKTPLLLDLLDNSEGRVLVFARTKRKVERLLRTVKAQKHRVAQIHGDRSQGQRTAAMKGFRHGKHRILIATDIAARGIDVADIEHVVNYDFPGCAEDYIHRIGRTARVAASGVATSFVTHNDRDCIKSLEKLISTELQLTNANGEPVRRVSAAAPPGGAKRGHARRRGKRRARAF